MSTPSIIYRRLDANHEPQFGNGINNFLSGIEAVAQAIQTRLLLFEGEWWDDLADGLPLWQKILGVSGVGRNLDAVNLLIQQRIVGTPHVTGIENIQSSYDSTTRRINFYCEAKTEFGTVVVQNIPTPPLQGIL